MTTDPAFEDPGLAGYQAVEFLDIPPMSESRSIFSGPDRTAQSAARLDVHMRSTITRWTRGYIASLVDWYHGAEEDVRYVIENLSAEEADA